jgi:hypothetical protein
MLQKNILEVSKKNMYILKFNVLFLKISCYFRIKIITMETECIFSYSYLIALYFHKFFCISIFHIKYLIFWKAER